MILQGMIYHERIPHFPPHTSLYHQDEPVPYELIQTASLWAVRFFNMHSITQVRYPSPMVQGFDSIGQMPFSVISSLAGQVV